MAEKKQHRHSVRIAYISIDQAYVAIKTTEAVVSFAALKCLEKVDVKRRSN
jgi:hypothetical protein